MIKEIKVGGHLFKVLYPYIFKESVGTKGQCDTDLNEMRIKSTDGCGNQLAESTLEVVLIHEILHAINKAYCSDSLEEDEICCFAEGLFQVLKDNYGFSFLDTHSQRGLILSNPDEDVLQVPLKREKK